MKADYDNCSGARQLQLDDVVANVYKPSAGEHRRDATMYPTALQIEEE